LLASLFEQAETLAGEMQISQSFLSEIALEEFIRRRENQQLLEKINADL
jgi:predicted transcriptional regulator